MTELQIAREFMEEFCRKHGGSYSVSTESHESVSDQRISVFYHRRDGGVFKGSGWTAREALRTLANLLEEFPGEKDGGRL